MTPSELREQIEVDRPGRILFYEKQIHEKIIEVGYFSIMLFGNIKDYNKCPEDNKVFVPWIYLYDVLTCFECPEWVVSGTTDYHSISERI